MFEDNNENEFSRPNNVYLNKLTHKKIINTCVNEKVGKAIYTTTTHCCRFLKCQICSAIIICLLIM